MAPMHRVKDLADPRLDLFRNLKKSNQNRRSNTFVAEGAKLLDRMLEVGWPLTSTILTEPMWQQFRERLPIDAEHYVLEKSQIESLIGFRFHRGVLACGRRPDPWPMERLIPASDVPARLLVLVDVHDPENVGNIIRSASALGVSGIILTGESADPFSRRVLRTSMGGVLLTPLCVIPHAASAIRTLARDHGLETWATVLDEHATPLEATRPSQRWAMVVGSEGDGLDQETLEACTHRVTIPMRPLSDSLNVAVATGIVLYHFTRGDGRSPENV